MSKSKPHPITVITEGVEELDVVRAWRRIDSARTVPPRVEILRRKNKSLTCRLASVGDGGTDVIAKRCVVQTGQVERYLYGEQLPRLSVSQLRYYGSTDVADDLMWIFLEDARGVEFDRDDIEHRRHAARWLAQLHTESAELREMPGLPERSTQHYRAHMHEARQQILDNYDTPHLEDEGRVTLDRILRLFDAAEANWSQIEALCAQVPHALIHGDFAARNVRIRPGLHAHEPHVLLAFDWEVAGWGLPVVDLACADLPTYGACVRDRWPDLDLETLTRLVHVGSLLRGGFAATNWAAVNLETEWPQKAIYKMQSYDTRMTRALRAIGWAA